MQVRSSAVCDRIDFLGEVRHFPRMKQTQHRPLSEEEILTGTLDRRTTEAALAYEITLIEEARNALPDDSHLRALCSLAAERLSDFVSRPQNSEATQDLPCLKSA